MSFGSALVAIVAIVAFAVMRMVRYTTEHRSRTLAAPPDSGDKGQLRREVEELRERVRVLERIATEANTTAALESRRVADEIEALRDRQSS